MESILRVAIPFSRRVWLSISIAIFVGLGAARFFEFFGPPASLFSWWLCLPSALLGLLAEPAPFRMQYGFYLLLLLLLTVLLAALALALGWLIAAILGLVLLLKRRRRAAGKTLC